MKESISLLANKIRNAQELSEQDCIDITDYLDAFAARLAQEKAGQFDSFGKTYTSVGEAYYDRNVARIRQWHREHAQGTGGDMEILLAIIEWQAKRVLASQKAGTCETCQFAGERLRSIYGEMGMYPNHRACKLLGARPGSPIQSNIVPLTLNGRPFRCDGWKAKEMT